MDGISFKLNRAIYGIAPADFRRTLDELVALLDLEPLLRKPVRTLSLGERMKCEVAAALLPFRWTTSFPVELLLGRVGFTEALYGLAAQAAWLGLCLLLLRLVWRAGLRVYSAVGA